MAKKVPRLHKEGGLRKVKTISFHMQYILNRSDKLYSWYWYTGQVMKNKAVRKKKISHITLIT